MTESVEEGQSKDEKGYAPSVFISHKCIESDNRIARSLANDLEKLGCSVYLDLNRRRSIVMDKDIPKFLDSADFVIALISAEADDSNWVKGELERAASLNYKFGRPHIVPIRINFTGQYSMRLAAILGGIDPISSNGYYDPDLLDDVKSALGLGRSIRRTVPRKRSRIHLASIVGAIGLGLVLISIAYLWLAGSQDDYSPVSDPFSKAPAQPSASPSASAILRKTDVPKDAPRSDSGDSSEDRAPISDAKLLNELTAAHNQTRIGSPENNEKARRLYRNTLNKLPSATRQSLSPTCARLLRDAEADYQSKDDDAALRNYDAFFTICIKR